MDNKIGITYTHWATNFDQDLSDLISYLRKASDLGFEVVELFPSVVLDLSEEEQKKLGEAAKEENIDLNYVTALSEEYDISSKKKDIRDNGINHLKEIIKAIHKTGGKKLSGVIYGALGKVPEEGESKSDHLKRSVESMKEAIKVAEDLDILVNVEAVNRYETFMLNTSEEAIDYVERVNSPNLKIHLDTYHMNIEEDDLREAIVNAGDDLGHFHVGENNRKPPGMGGHIDWDEVMLGLKENGYRGSIVMEPFIQSEGEVGFMLKVWRNMIEDKDLDEEAKKSLQFVKNKLENSKENKN